ncbi:MAG TPA: hypothetical protein VEW46_24775, partial [Pyrinomonadaceae bacterium]|nr:hypothetical protein [Pyrinomonadaceae bacterium]
CGGSAGTCSECDKGKESLSSQSGAQGLRLGNSRGVLHNAHHFFRPETVMNYSLLTRRNPSATIVFIEVNEINRRI